MVLAATVALLWVRQSQDSPEVSEPPQVTRSSSPTPLVFSKRAAADGQFSGGQTETGGDDLQVGPSDVVYSADRSAGLGNPAYNAAGRVPSRGVTGGADLQVGATNVVYSGNKPVGIAPQQTIDMAQPGGPPRPTVFAAAQPQTPALPGGPYTVNAVAPLQPGESLVLGGWPMDDDRRGYAIVTPQTVVEPDGTERVVMESRVLAIPNDALADAGLQEIVVEHGQAERYGVTDGPTTQELLDRIAALDGVRILGTPNLAATPGEEAQMHAESFGGDNVHIYLRPGFATNGAGYDLEFDFGTARPTR